MLKFMRKHDTFTVPEADRYNSSGIELRIGNLYTYDRFLGVRNTINSSYLKEKEFY